jgi:hypothetical protein
MQQKFVNFGLVPLTCVSVICRYGIMFVTFISWLPNHGATYFGESSQIKGGCWLPLVSTFESLSHTVTDSDPASHWSTKGGEGTGTI